MKDFYFDISMPSQKVMLTYSAIIAAVIFLIGLIVGLAPFLLIFLSIIIVMLFGIYGFIVYVWWLFIARVSVNLFLENPLKRLRGKDQNVSFFLKLIFGQDLERAFVQVKTQNKDISTPRGLVKEMSRIAISFYAFSFFFATYLDNNLAILSGLSAWSSIIYSLLFAMTLAPLFLGLYIPFALVIEDSRLMLLREDGSIDYLGTPIRTLLDGIFGVSGLVAGYSLISKYTQTGFDIPFYLLFFGSIMALYFVFMLPFLLPLMYFYYQQHVRMVNRIRKLALEVHVIPAWTKLDPLSEDETKILTRGVIEQFEQLPQPSITQDVLHPRQAQQRQREVTHTEPPSMSTQEVEKPMDKPRILQDDYQRPRGTNFCTYCGYKLKNQQNYCNKCGNRVKRMPQ